MGKVCSFVVYGSARPQGSTRTRTFRDAKGNLRTTITHSNRESLMQWRSDIRASIQLHAPDLKDHLVRGPVAVRVIFYVTKPPSIAKKRIFPVTAPDLDKTCRAVGDALEHTIVYNDSQIVCWEAWKVYTEGASKAEIEIWQPDQLPERVRERNPFQEALF